MKLVLSPAKSLNFESELPTVRTSEGCFLKEAERLNKLLKKKSARSLSKLMKISDALGQLNRINRLCIKYEAHPNIPWARGILNL